MNEVEYDVIAECGRYKFGVVNYNSMVDVCTDNENGQCCILVIDAGLLKLGWPSLDAQFNWWNHETGPSGYGPGNGEAVDWEGKPVDYMPWLYVEHCKALCDQTGYFGIAYKLCKGLNAVSTPIALSDGYDRWGDTVPASRLWKDVLANSGIETYKYLMKWDGSWTPVDPETEEFNPLVGYYIYLFEDCHSLILLVNANETSMPTRTLSAGWNLIGPNPLFPEDSMPVDDALVSVAQIANGNPGYTQAISPIVRCQDAWYYVQGMKCAPSMQSGRGYWVYMLNEAVLVGFGFSWLPDQLSKIYGGYWD